MMNAESYLRDGNCPSVAVIRQVWAELTREPGAYYTTIGRRIGRHASIVRYAVAMLIAAGYVESVPRCHGARQVIVPFYAEVPL